MCDFNVEIYNYRRSSEKPNFYDCETYHNENEPMFLKYGQDWKQFQSKLTPTFTYNNNSYHIEMIQSEEI